MTMVVVWLALAWAEELHKEAVVLCKERRIPRIITIIMEMEHNMAVEVTTNKLQPIILIAEVNIVHFKVQGEDLDE